MATNRTLILIKDDGLEVINIHGKTELNFKDLTIKLSQLVNQTEEPQEAVILLSDGIVFSKTFDIKDPSIAQISYDRFISTVPFSLDKISKIKLYENDKLTALATNKDLYQGIIDILLQANWVVKAVIPQSAYNLAEKNVTSDQVNKIFTESDSLKKFNFLDQNLDVKIDSLPKETSEVTKPLGKIIKNRWYLYLLLLFIILILIAHRYFFKDRFISQPKPIIQVEKTADVSIEASVSARPQLSREEVAIKVLNASGKSGEAGRIKDLLTGLGFINISASNYTKIIDNTSVQFGGEIPENIKQEIVGELNKSIASVSAETTSSATKNIVIIIGK
jgi:hypothetical protein